MRRTGLLLSLIFACFAFGVFAVASVSAQEPGPGEQLYVVVRGDSLSRISAQFRVPVSTIAARNGILNVNLIFIGQRIIIPSPGSTPPTATQPGPTQPPPTPGGTITYVVVPGDTLGAIARRFGTTVSAIAQLNGIVNPNLIRVGQVLLISGTPPAPTPTRTSPAPTQPPGGTPSGTFELGGHAITFAYPQQMRSADMTWVKIQIRWSVGDPPSIAQGAVDAARANGFKVLLGIVGVPAQMGQDLPAYYQQFANFLGGVAGSYHPDAIEVWNEPNIDREWPAGRITPSGYALMLRRAYEAIKAASPQTMVISGAPAPTGYFGGGCTGNGCDDRPFMQQVANAGGGAYMDCVGIHYNEGVLSPDATSGDPRGNPNHYTRYYRSMVNTYAAIFPNKNLCFTELGYLTREGLGDLPPSFAWANSTTIAQQGDWLARAATLSRQHGRIRLMIIWNVDATHYAGDDPQAGYAIVRNGQCSACAKLAAAMP